MYCLVAIGLMLVYAALKPLSEGLFDTSMWVAKILAPSEFQDNAATKQFLKFGQAASETQLLAALRPVSKACL
jgi:hypothetical protein